MYEWKNKWMNESGWMNDRIDERIDEWMNGVLCVWVSLWQLCLRIDSQA